MTEAHALREKAPVKAAVIAQLAVAIAILTHAPVRLVATWCKLDSAIT